MLDAPSPTAATISLLSRYETKKKEAQTMAYTETHAITLTKPAKRQLQDKVIRGNQTGLIASVVNKSVTVRGWSIDPAMMESEVNWIQQPDEDGYVYTMFLTVTFSREDGKKPDTFEFGSLMRTLSKRSNTPNYGSWTLATVDGEPYIVPVDDDELATVNTDLIGYAEVTVPEDYEENFTHLFGLEAHIARIKFALEAGIMSDWRNRFHCALVGPPGCGKSDICGTLKRIFGEDAVMEFDATATTAAGAIKELAEREILPRVLLVEEIEKADPKSLAFLLALCDLRGEIRKTTARATIQRDTKVLVVATVNDYELFGTLQAGALASRFANTIWFQRPSRETLTRILVREVQKIRGDETWVKPAIDFAEEQNIDDPRMVIALCLCGRDKLLTGEYQKMLAATAPPK
jgi:hypothetical protein